jgi:phage tail sheath gpL-like
MAINATSLAAAVGVRVQNVVHKPTAEVMPRKILICGQYDPLLTSTVEDVPVLAATPEWVAATYGEGFMLHKLAEYVQKGAGGIEMWVAPQDPTAGVAATGTSTWTASGVLAGTVHMYVGGEYIPFDVADADDATAVAAAQVAAITAATGSMVTAANVAGVTTTTSKTTGTWGNRIIISYNENGETFPTGVSVVVVAMSSGSGVPTIDDVLTELGTGDNANEANFTEVVHGYGNDTTTLDALHVYNGTGNLNEGLYEDIVARPFRSLFGDVDSSLAQAVVIGDARKLDRTNGVLAIPGSSSMPDLAAAAALGIMARINSSVAEQHYLKEVLPDILPGPKTRWTKDYSSRETALKAGVSPTNVRNNAVILTNVATFYHPDDVPVNSNIYRSQRNISILQNMKYNTKAVFNLEKWQGISIVEDISKVVTFADREKTKDVDAVKDEWTNLLNEFAGKAWIYQAAFSIDNMSIAVRSGGIGFDVTVPVILSGEGGIFNNIIQADTSLAILT